MKAVTHLAFFLTLNLMTMLDSGHFRFGINFLFNGHFGLEIHLYVVYFAFYGYFDFDIHFEHLKNIYLKN